MYRYAQPREGLQTTSEGFIVEERTPNSDYEWNPTTKMIYINLYIDTYSHTNIFIYEHIYICVYIYIYIYIYKCIYIFLVWRAGRGHMTNRTLQECLQERHEAVRHFCCHMGRTLRRTLHLSSSRTTNGVREAEESRNAAIAA